MILALRFRHSYLPLLCGSTLILCGALTGCGMGTQAGPVDTQIAGISGQLHGGNNPISNATIYLYATSDTATATSSGYSETAPAALDSATTDNNGNFTFGASPSYTCPAGEYAYIRAVGGNPGLGSTPSPNPIDLVAAIGPCSSLSTSTFVEINEVTTIAAAYALGGFYNAGSGFAFATDSTNLSGLGVAFSNAAKLVPVSSAAAGGNRGTVGTNGTVPTATINTLADILQSCVNSTGSGSTACTNLFAAVQPPSATGIAAPTDTWQAALDLAKYPNPNPPSPPSTALFNQVATSPAFLPNLSTAPADWTLAISYGGMTGVQYLAVDGNDNVYVSEDNSSYQVPTSGTSTYSNSVVEFASDGVQSSTNLVYNSSSPTLSLFSDPDYLAVDNNNNLWVTNGGAATPPTAKAVYGPANSNVAFELPANNGTPTVTQTTGFDDPQSLAVDASNNIWIGNGVSTGTFGIYGISEITSGGTYTTFGTNGAGGKTTSGCSGVAVDTAETVWCTTGFNYKMYRFAAPYTTAPAYKNLTPDDPQQVAIDSSQNGWTDMEQYSTAPASLTEVSAGTGSSATETDYEGLNGLSTSSTDNVWGLAIDGLGNIWFANSTQNGLSEFNPFVGTSTTASGSGPGTALSESGGFTPGQASGGTGNLLSDPYSVAVDSAGAIWVSNYNGTSVVQILGPGAPTEPLLGKQKFGTLP